MADTQADIKNCGGTGGEIVILIARLIRIGVELALVRIPVEARNTATCPSRD